MFALYLQNFFHSKIIYTPKFGKSIIQTKYIMLNKHNCIFIIEFV
jgi:hypothetical protein